jgi:hypothetical protein
LGLNEEYFWKNYVLDRQCKVRLKGNFTLLQEAKHVYEYDFKVEIIEDVSNLVVSLHCVDSS